MDDGKSHLSKEAIFAADDILTEEVYIPEWKGTVTVCGMTGAGKDAYEKSIVDIKGNKHTINRDHLRGKLLLRTVCDANRQPLFTESDLIRLGTKSASVLDRLCEVAQRLSGMRQEDADELKKTSETTPSDDSVSVSLSS